jgi:hypothetical protein
MTLMSTPRAFAVTSLFIFAVQGIVCAQPPSRGTRIRLVPRNEAADAPGFAPVLARFEHAIRTQDAQGVLALLGENVAFTFGGAESTPAGFRKSWNLDDPSSEFWTAAADLLQGGSTFGCSEEACSVTYPFWYTEFPVEFFDPLEFAVIKGGDIPLYSDPRSSASVVGRLSYDIVKLDDTPVSNADSDVRFTAPVILADGRRGYVDPNALYQVVHYRMQFTQVKGGPWRLTMFIAGD